MTQKLRFPVLGLLLYYCTLPACLSDQLPEPMSLAVCDTLQASYNNNVKEIIDRTCAYSGCHIDASFGNYLTYEGMIGRLQNGSIRNRMINLKDDPVLGMPPDYAPPDRPRDLTQEELDMIECWLDAGFPRE